MQMPGRKYSAENSAKYRYGFNGKENDNEVKGEGNQQDYGMRIYDPRLGRFLSKDPIAHEYPNLSTFQFASNSPIANLDLDGLESVYYTTTINFITNYKRQPDGSVKTWTSKQTSNDGAYKMGLFGSNGSRGSGTFYTTQIRVSEVFYDVNGITTSRCDESPIIVQQIYKKSRADLMKDVGNRPMFEGKVQLVVYGRALDNSESPASRMNPNAKTFSIDMNAFNKYLEPIMIGMDPKVPGNVDVPSLEDIAYGHVERAIEKAENSLEKSTNSNTEKVIGVINLDSQYRPNSKLCTGCGYSLPPQQDTGHFGLPGVSTGSSGKIQQVYEKNTEKKKVDTLNNKP
jgi:RHS repeat-associated protein